jgi:SAM-dependent methyltransferase
MQSFEKYQLHIKKHFPDYRFSWEIFTDIILENMASRPYWLDIGAGNNAIIKEQPGAEFAVGLDIEKPQNIKFAENEAFSVASAEYLPFKDNSFGFITSRYTFEHLKSPLLTLEEIERILKPKGIFVLQTTNRKSPYISFSRLIPFEFKKRLFKSLFRDIPSGIFKTYYRINTPRVLRRNFGSLMLQKMILAEDILCHNRFFFWFSFFAYKLMHALKLNTINGNIIAIYIKEV